MKRLALSALIVLPALGLAQSPLVTLPPNNGSGGIFFNLTPSSNQLTWTGFQTYFASAAGSAVSIQVYTRPGSYVGFQSNSAGWTLTQTVSGTSAGSGNTNLSALIPLTAPITLGAGQTTGVYLHSVTTGGGIRYQGTGTTSTSTFSNADLTLFSQHSRTGAVPFAGSLFTPRAFAGAIHYNVVPEPATMAVLGLGAVALIRRRIRR